MSLEPGARLGPVWSRDGKELFFRHARQLMAADIRTSPVLSAERTVA